jgi:hypothetical protein
MWSTLKKTLIAGFTMVRDVGSSDYINVALSRSIYVGEVPCPRLAVSRPVLGITGGYCDDKSPFIRLNLKQTECPMGCFLNSQK